MIWLCLGLWLKLWLGIEFGIDGPIFVREPYTYQELRLSDNDRQTHISAT